MPAGSRATLTFCNVNHVATYDLPLYTVFDFEFFWDTGWNPNLRWAWLIDHWIITHYIDSGQKRSHLTKFSIKWRAKVHGHLLHMDSGNIDDCTCLDFRYTGLS